MKINEKYLVLPLGFHAQTKKIEFYMENKLVYDIDAKLDVLQPDYFQYLNVEQFLGKDVEVVCPQCKDVVFATVDEVPMAGVYKEKYRPTVHFSAARGWINDPNGLVYYNGTYHMFFQHNPAGNKWGNMHWGHAISNDLIHWDEQDSALFPDDMGTMFSGSGIVDYKNVTGLKTNENDVILLFYTAAGNNNLISKGKKFTQCIAYSTDGGVTFDKYNNNPVVDHIEAENRDPKVIYSPELDKYIMALYLIENRYALFVSDDLLKWNKLQELNLPGDTECPDFYPLVVDGDENNIKWVFSGASDRYLVGDIIVGKYRPSQLPKSLHYGQNSYAAQTFSDISPEDGRRIRVAWNTFEIPDTHFNCSMCFPSEMTLKTIDGEIYLCTLPIKEIETIYMTTETYTNQSVSEDNAFKLDLKNKAYDIELDMTCLDNSETVISMFGMNIFLEFKENQLSFNNNTMPLFISDNKIKLRIIVDTNGIEIYAGQGQAHMCVGYLCDYNLSNLELRSTKGSIEIDRCRISELEGIWTKE